MRVVASVSLILFTAIGAFGQSAAPLAFEVASVKPAPPPTEGRMMVRMGGDPGRVSYSNVSLRDLIRNAYGVKEYQISAPDWMGSARFDLNAKLPEGATRDQVPQMLQALLVERFKMTVHRETKELPMYALVVAKNGPKLKESAVDPNATAGGGVAGGAGGANRSMVDGPGGPPKITIGKDGMPQLPPGMAGRGMMLMNGRGHVAVAAQPVSALADFLSRQMDRPVVDMTGLKGNYDFTLDYTPEEGQRRMEGGPGDGGGPAPEPHAPDPSGPSIFTAVQAQLGLKLEARKGPVDLIVIESAEKIPTEN
jgi:uncharacterized protein (TIGR03435 family)